MHPSEQRRRQSDRPGAPAAQATSGTVREGLLLQQASTTVAAVEFLMTRGIDPAVIRRVMAGRGLRESDRAALQAAPAMPR